MHPDGSIISGADALAEFAAAAADTPAATALLCDIDGTIAPIAPRPSDARVPDRFRDLLEDLVSRLGLVAFITGRALADGQRMIPLDGAEYVGTHGLETMGPDGILRVDPAAERYVEVMQEVIADAARDLDCEALGIVLEDKRTVLAAHYRLAPDAAETRHQILTRVVEPARARGLAIATGHFSIEVRPPVSFSKGASVRRLLAAGDYLSAMFCGDDLTDVTGFTAIKRWSEGDARRRTCALAAITHETPRPVIDAADVLVRATPGVQHALTTLRTALGDGTR